MGPEIPTPANTPPEENGFIKMAEELKTENASSPTIGQAPASELPPAEEQQPTTEQPPANRPIPIGEPTSVNKAPSIGVPENHIEKAASSETTPDKPAAESPEQPERIPDFTSEELQSFEKYADDLEHSAKADLKMADLLHQFVDVARHQSSPAHHTPAATESTTNLPRTPEAAITAALAETENSPIPGPATIVTPTSNPSEFLSAS